VPEAERAPNLLDAGIQRLDRAVHTAAVGRPLPLLGLVVDRVPARWPSCAARAHVSALGG
jgi:hypothetical protein